jgi:hypothetical protein
VRDAARISHPRAFRIDIEKLVRDGDHPFVQRLPKKLKAIV